MRGETGYLAALPEMASPPDIKRTQRVDVTPALTFAAPDAKVGYYKTVVFTFKEGKGAEWLAHFKADADGAPITAGTPGMVKYELFQDSSNPDKMIIWEEWKDEASFNGYFAMRMESGYVDKWFGVEMCNFVAPPMMDSCVRKFGW